MVKKKFNIGTSINMYLLSFLLIASSEDINRRVTGL